MTIHYLFAPPTHTNTKYYVNIPSATLETIFHALKLDYLYHTKPIELFIVAGYNDLIKNIGRYVIIDNLVTMFVC